jgi:3-phenylpropionate/cinnamic acid dioxygenase small subunit
LLSDHDRIELHELAARYGDLVDAGAWDALGSIFTEEALWEASDTRPYDLRGVEAIRAHFESRSHRIAHHITNVHADESDGIVQLRYRVVVVNADGTVGSGDYRDDVVRTPDGWRIATRRFRLRRP